MFVMASMLPPDTVYVITTAVPATKPPSDATVIVKLPPLTYPLPPSTIATAVTMPLPSVSNVKVASTSTASTVITVPSSSVIVSAAT